MTQGRLFTFGSGGWVLLCSAIIALGITAWALSGALVRSAGRVGDGTNVASYGFDLGTCLVPSDLIVAGGLPKDGLRALVEAPVIAGADIAEFNSSYRGKFLVSTDRVIGVSINGEARAYPLPVMQCHEVANDVLGGEPIAVTYNPLCDSAVVFDRAVDGATLEFGVSGLLYNSNMLMYDRHPRAEAESLWSQLLASAIAGPAAQRGSTLRVLPAWLCTWGEWLAAHPHTSVLKPDPGMIRRYKETNYQGYFLSSRLLFPVSPAAPPDGPGVKEPVIVVGSGPKRLVVPFSTIARRAGADGTWRDDLDGIDLTFRYRRQPETVTVTVSGRPEDPSPPTVYAFWFAWHAMYPGEEPLM